LLEAQAATPCKANPGVLGLMRCTQWRENERVLTTEIKSKSRIKSTKLCALVGLLRILL